VCITSIVDSRGSLFGRKIAQIFGPVFELRQRVKEDHVDLPDWAVALFGENQLRQAAQIFAVAFIYFFAKNKANEVGILLNRVVYDEVSGNEVVMAGHREIENLLLTGRRDALNAIPINVTVRESRDLYRFHRFGQPGSAFATDVLFEN
jgi:hypothetical protein